MLLSAVVLSMVHIVYAPGPEVYVDPPVSTANPTEYVDVNISIDGVVDLYAWGIKMYFDPNVLEVAYYYVGPTKVYNITEGPFLKDGTTSPSGTSFAAKAYTNYIDVGCTTLGAYPGVSGSGILMTVTFYVKDSGKSDLDITKSDLLDSTLTAITHDVSDGFFYTPARANLVKKSAWPSKHHFVVSKHGPNQTLYGIVKNLGSLDLHVYVRFDIVRDDTLIATVTTSTTVLAPDTQMLLSADFGPLTEADVGKYYVSATVWYSWSGFYYTQGDKLKTFSFAVVP